MDYVLLFIEDFRDYNVYPKLIRAQTLIKADEMLKKRFEQSAPGSFEIQSRAVPEPTFKCQVCNKVCKSELGLASHMRKHEQK